MIFSAWLRNWERSLERRWALHRALRHKRAARRQAARLHLEVLEGRTVPTVSVLGSYPGMNEADVGHLPPPPPDTQSAAGPSSVVETVNSEVTIYSPRSTRSNIVSDSLPGFLFTQGNLPRTNPTGYLSDSFDAFDNQIQRFVVGEMDFGTTTGPTTSSPSFCDFAVSKSSNPATLTTADWNFFQVNVTKSGYTPDYPGNLGWNANSLVFTLAMFKYSTTALVFDHSQVDAISNQALLNGSPIQEGTNASQNDVSGQFVRPTVMQDDTTSSSNPDPMWFIEETNPWNHQAPPTSTIQVVQWTNSNSYSSAPNLVTTSLHVNEYWTATPPLQPDGSPITTVSYSTFMNAMMANGMIVTAQAVSNEADNLDEIQWYEIDTNGGTPTLQQEGDVSGGPGTYYAYPGIAINSSGDIGMSYNASGTGQGQYLSVYVTGRTPSDPSGTMETPVLVQAGNSNNYDDVEGDMSGINVDSNGNFWIANEYALDKSWGTAIAHFTMASPVYVVTKTTDDGSTGTLRDAINQVNLGNYNKIDFAIGTSGSAQTINLTSALPALYANGVYINGLSQGGSGNTVPLITVNGSGAGAGADGLLLQGANEKVTGLIVQNFSNNGIEVAGDNDTIGGSSAGAGNVLSSNANDGVLIDGGVSGTVVQGNKIGTNAAGTAALGNGGNGIEDQGDIDEPGFLNILGGSTSTARNLISANRMDGILLGTNTDEDTVQGNFILGNGVSGIEVQGSNDIIGGSVSGAGNVISGNVMDGILLGTNTDEDTVQGNFILGNGVNGIGVQGISNIIGGSVSGAGNSIAFNNQGGVLVSLHSRNTIRHNALFANGSTNTGPGITLIVGANHNLASPSLNSATFSISTQTLTVTGSFTAPTANVSYVLDFYANPSGDAEGKVYLGSSTVTPASTGTRSFTFTTTTSEPATYPLITATLTDNLGDTSAFSNGVTIAPPPPGGPTVTSLQRYGYHLQPTLLVLSFSAPLDPARAQNVNNYQIVTLGGPGRGGSLHGHRIAVARAFYNPTANTVILDPAERLDIHNTYQLIVVGTSPNGLTSATGLFLDGADNGKSGSNYQVLITRVALAGPASDVPTQAAARTRTALPNARAAAALVRRPSLVHPAVRARTAGGPPRPIRRG